MADKSFEIAVQLTAIDNMTAAIRKSLGTNGSALQTFASRANAVSQKASQIGKQTAIAGLALAAPLVLATKAAIEFEGAMADVAKVANLDKGSAQFKNVSSEALKLSTYLGTNSTDVAKLYSNLIAGGTTVNQLKQVATIAGEAAVAFDITQEAAGEAFATMRNSMGLTIQDAKKAFDATNAISNKFGGKASSLLEFMTGGGASVARTLKTNAPEMEAFGRALTMSGVSGAEAGTVMNRFRVGLYKNAEAMAIFNKAGGGSNGMVAIFEQAAKSGDPFKWFQKHKFGEYSSQMSLLAGNSGKLGEMLKFVRKEQNFLGSSTAEFNSRMDTTGMKLEKAKISFQNAAIKAGTALLPVLTKLINTVTPIIEKISAWISKNPELTATILKITAAIAGLLLAVSGISYAIAGIAKIASVVSTVTTFLMANPIILIIAAIAAAAYLIYRNWDKIKAFFINLWTGIKAMFWKVVAWIKEWGILFLGPIGFIIKYWDNILNFFKALPSKMKVFGINMIKGLWEGIKSVIMLPLNLINSLGKVLGFKVGGSIGVGSTPVVKKAGGAINPRAGAGGLMSYSPTVTIQGGSPTAKEDFKKILQDHSQDMFRIMKEQERKNGRAVLQ